MGPSCWLALAGRFVAHFGIRDVRTRGGHESNHSTFLFLFPQSGQTARLRDVRLSLVETDQPVSHCQPGMHNGRQVMNKAGLHLEPSLVPSFIQARSRLVCCHEARFGRAPLGPALPYSSSALASFWLVYPRSKKRDIGWRHKRPQARRPLAGSTFLGSALFGREWSPGPV